MIININSLIFFKNFLPDKDLAKYFLRARLTGSTTFCTSGVPTLSFIHLLRHQATNIRFSNGEYYINYKIRTGRKPLRYEGGETLLFMR